VCDCTCGNLSEIARSFRGVGERRWPCGRMGVRISGRTHPARTRAMFACSAQPPTLSFLAPSPSGPKSGAVRPCSHRLAARRIRYLRAANHREETRLPLAPIEDEVGRWPSTCARILGCLSRQRATPSYQAFERNLPLYETPCEARLDRRCALGARHAPSRSPVSRHPDRLFRGIVIARFAGRDHQFRGW
jgi:hypothetical protein